MSKKESKNKKGHLKPKILAGVVTVSILALLLVAGPVGAFIMDLDLSDNNVKVGTSVDIIATATFEQGDDFNVSYFVLDLDGPVSISCTFLPDGTPITSCNGITIQQIHAPVYGGGYGYGYGYGSFVGNYTFKITLSTLNYPLGTYETNLLALTTQGVMEFQGDDLTIYDEEITLGRCSVRAKDGEMYLLGDFFGTENDFSYYHPHSGNSQGQGFLTAQYRNQRFSYKFQTEDIISKTPNQIEILVKGKYKIQTGPWKEDVEAILTIHKNQNRVTLTSTDFGGYESNINFLVGCF
jgi:hypothetical protein